MIEVNAVLCVALDVDGNAYVWGRMTCQPEARRLAGSCHAGNIFYRESSIPTRLQKSMISGPHHPKACREKS